MPFRPPPPRRLMAGVVLVALTLLAAPAAGAEATREGTDGPDRLAGTAAADVLAGLRGPDLLLGGAGDDVLEGGPGYDVLRGGPGADRLEDGSFGAGILAGGAGDDVITSSPRGMDRVVCGPGADTVSADALDIVAADCETVVRTTGRPAATPVEVLSVAGALLGTTAYPLSPGGAAGPYRLLWVHNGFTYLASRFRGGGACFLTVEPGGGGRAECGLGPRGGMFVRRIEGPRFQWFALVPVRVRALSVGGQTIPVRAGVAAFPGPRHPGAVVARGGGPAFALRVP